jgi:hypothetical protein
VCSPAQKGGSSLGKRPPCEERLPARGILVGTGWAEAQSASVWWVGLFPLTRHNQRARKNSPRPTNRRSIGCSPQNQHKALMDFLGTRVATRAARTAFAIGCLFAAGRVCPAGNPAAEASSREKKRTRPKNGRRCLKTYPGEAALARRRRSGSFLQELCAASPRLVHSSIARTSLSASLQSPPCGCASSRI